MAAALRFQVHPRSPGCGGRSAEPARASDRIEGIPCRQICGWPVPCRIDVSLDRTRAGPARFEPDEKILGASQCPFPFVGDSHSTAFPRLVMMEQLSRD